jgi:hypothetical protein
MSSLTEQNGHDQHGSRKRTAHEHQQNNATRLGAQRVGLGCAESEAKVRRDWELGDELEGEKRMTSPCERKWKDEHKEQIRECQREYQQKYRKVHPLRDRRKESQQYIERYPQKVKAQHLANYHCSLGSNCLRCGSTERLEKHHFDYDKPLEVVTLCQKCHRLIHKYNN